MLLSHICWLFIFSSVANSLKLEDNTDPEAGFVPRVVNGRPAKLGDVPYQIAFKQKISWMLYMTFCGGILISDRKLISAAHCFEERGSRCFKGQVSQRYLTRIKAVAGNLFNLGKIQDDSLENGQWRSLENMVYPKLYRFPNNDISVGNTKRPFLINANVKPIAWATQFAEYRGTCLVSGFGRVSKHVSSSSLLLADLKIIPTNQCSRMHRRLMVKFVCTDVELSDVGEGDSGGPLVCTGTGHPEEVPGKGILVGVVSGTRLTVGSFFTRVSSYSKFIRNSAHTMYIGSNMLFLINVGRRLFLFCFNSVRLLCLNNTNRVNYFLL